MEELDSIGRQKSPVVYDKKLSLRVSPAQRRKLERIARSRGKRGNLSAAVRWAVDNIQILDDGATDAP